jgi:osmoprotectant transport system ATP-binding protein
VIVFDHVSKRYSTGGNAVNDLSFEVAGGEVVVLVGPSGCGKTTTLKMINRLIEPTSGRITIDGRDTRDVDVNTLRRSIGYVIQQVGLFPHLTVAELLELIGLPPSEYARRLPGELSGGQRQRVGVARALGADPPILLMDEPFGAIDQVTRERLQDELLRLQNTVRKTIVFVTHDIEEATKLGDRVALLNIGGVLEQYAPPADLLAHPNPGFVENFLGEGRLVRRLALIPLRDVQLPPLNGNRVPATRVGIESTLRDALDAVLRAPDGQVAVVDGERITGVVDADIIREASR